MGGGGSDVKKLVLYSSPWSFKSYVQYFTLKLSFLALKWGKLLSAVYFLQWTSSFQWEFFKETGLLFCITFSVGGNLENVFFSASERWTSSQTLAVYFFWFVFNSFYIYVQYVLELLAWHSNLLCFFFGVLGFGFRVSFPSLIIAAILLLLLLIMIMIICVVCWLVRRWNQFSLVYCVSLSLAGSAYKFRSTNRKRHIYSNEWEIIQIGTIAQKWNKQTILHTRSTTTQIGLYITMYI